MLYSISATHEAIGQLRKRDYYCHVVYLLMYPGLNSVQSSTIHGNSLLFLVFSSLNNSRSSKYAFFGREDCKLKQLSATTTDSHNIRTI